MDKKQFLNNVHHTYRRWKFELSLSALRTRLMELATEDALQFDPEYVRLQRQINVAYDNAVKDLLTYIDNKTECKNL